jgi:hypothetical protein
MPKRGNSPSPCNGLFALEGLSFSTDSLRALAPGDDSAELLDGPTTACLVEIKFRFTVWALLRPVEQLLLRSILLGRLCFALPRSYTVTTAHSYNFLRIPKFVGFRK